MSAEKQTEKEITKVVSFGKSTVRDSSPLGQIQLNGVNESRWTINHLTVKPHALTMKEIQDMYYPN